MTQIYSATPLESLGLFPGFPELKEPEWVRRVCVCVHACACMHVYVHVCACLCTCVCACVCVHTHVLNDIQNPGAI